MTKQPKKISHRRPITPEDLLRFRVVSDPQIAPDGSRIVFVERHVGQRNEYVSNLWMVAAEKGAASFAAGLPTPPRRLVRRGAPDPAATPRSGDRAATRARCALHAPYPFTEGGKDHAPRWSPDGARIAFLRTTGSGQTQIYTIAAAGGEARPLSAFPEGSIGAFRWSPDGRCLAVSFRPQDAERTAQARDERREQGLSAPPWVLDDLYYRFDGDGCFGSQRHRLYLVDASGNGDVSSPGCVQRILQPHRELYGQDTLGTFTFDFSPDGRQLVVSTNRSKKPTIEPWKDELLRIDVATGRITRIRGLPPGPKTAVRWSPDGKTIAYAGRLGKDPAYSVENLELFVCDAARGAARSVTAAEDICLQAEGITDTATSCGEPVLHFSPDGGRIYFRLSVRGESHVVSVAFRGGEFVFHTRGACDVRLGNLSADGRKLALTVGDATTLAEVAVLEVDEHLFGASLPDLFGAGLPDLFGAGLPTPPTVQAGDLRLSRRRGQETTPKRRQTTPRPRRKPKMLTNLNGPLLAEVALSRPEPHWIRAADGQRVQVWVLKPLRRTGFQPVPDGLKIRPTKRRQKKVPAVLEIHGGPHGQYCASFFHEFQVLAAAGYAVFYANPRGSKGYGRAHCAAIRGRWGTADWTDIQAVIAFMKEQSFVDTRRMGVIGGSYGGYMTNWVIGHCRDFSAAVTDRCLSNLVSWSGNTDFIEPPSHYFPGNFWDQPEARWEQSPLRYAGNIATPTLIIHSEGDLRCSIEQAEQLYAALQVLGVPSRFVRYPASTSHGMSRGGPPDLRLHRLRQILGWWQEHLGRRGQR